MSTALYRRYRPDSFTDVIGQEHVTEPLMAALRSGRVNHAYLFSGPRGCGKTTSARIFARCMNCAAGPTDTPCGTCDSCIELARGGPGSLDVVEMDAASHGGVDDARELRERAAFAPARDRFKIFIIDEAHMVTTQGFNALLKLVEEPPEHVKFVFATTEPEKVIGTIRSRTHHYPFRLVPPDALLDYLGQLAGAEQVSIDSGVLPLVVRAGGGSVRDSLSVLDQLIAGAAEGQVTYERAVALLGFTHATLLDDAVDALAARDGASLFRVVDRVISTGHAPRRFVEDLLERLRDLIVVLAAGDQAGSVLRSVPEDQLERMRTQAKNLGLATASRAADHTNLALTEMVGATSPRLQLELLCARLLLPGADPGDDGYGARLDRLESSARGGANAPTPSSAARLPTAAPVPPAPPSPQQPAESGRRPAAASRHESSGERAPAGGTGAGSTHSEPSAEPTTPAVPAERSPDRAADAEPLPAATAASPTAAPSAATQPATAAAATAAAASPPADGGLTTEHVRRRWAEVLGTLAQIKRTTWALAQNAQVVDLGGGVLQIGFPTPGLVSTFRSGPHSEPLQRAIEETLGLQVRIDTVVNDGSAPSAPSVSASTPAPPPVVEAPGADRRAADPAQRPQPARESGRQPGPGSDADRRPQPNDRPSGRSTGHRGQEPEPPPWDDEPPPPWEEPPPPNRAVPAAAPTTVRSAPVRPGTARGSFAGDEPDSSDPDLENSGLVGAPLVAKMLGGTVIDEIRHDEGR